MRIRFEALIQFLQLIHTLGQIVSQGRLRIQNHVMFSIRTKPDISRQHYKIDYAYTISSISILFL